MAEWEDALVELGAAGGDEAPRRAELVAAVRRHITTLEAAVAAKAMDELPSVRRRELRTHLGERDLRFVGDSSDELFLAELYGAMLTDRGLLHLRPVTTGYWVVSARVDEVEPGDCLLYGVIADGWRHVGESLIVRFAFERLQVVAQPSAGEGPEEEILRGDDPFISAEIHLGDHVASDDRAGVVVAKHDDVVVIVAADGRTTMELAVTEVLRVGRRLSAEG